MSVDRLADHTLTSSGALAQALTADRYGRKWSIFIWAVRIPEAQEPPILALTHYFQAVFTVGTVIQTATIDSIAQITVGRFVAGLGVGAMSAIVPLYNGTFKTSTISN